jgi:hypothetical protein
MTEQNRKYLQKEILRIKGLAEQESGPKHPITKRLDGMHAKVQSLLHHNSGAR